MNTLARSVERGAFQMKAEHAGNLQAGLSSCSQLLDDLTSVGDQGWQATGGPAFAVRNYNFTNAPWDELHAAVEGFMASYDTGAAELGAKHQGRRW